MRELIDVRVCWRGVEGVKKKGRMCREIYYVLWID